MNNNILITKQNFEGQEVTFRINLDTQASEVLIDDVAKFCGWSYIKADRGNKEYIRWNVVNQNLQKLGVAEVCDGDFIPENVMYPLIGMADLSKNEKARKFMLWVGQVLTDIRLNGGYISEDATVEQVEKLVVNHSMRSITKQIEECPIMELETLVSKIIEDNTTGGKKTRIDTLLQKLNATEYKQHVRKHIRKAIEDKSWSNKVSEHGVELAIRDKLIIALTDDVLATNNRKFGKLIKK